jgi:uncharacterized membrane protein YcaP (DUF421 family)
VGSWPVNWSELFGLTVSPIEIVIRGTAVFWFLFAIFRLVLRREIGAVGIADVLVIVLIADASQNAMAGEYRSITDGFILVATIVFWNALLDWAAYRSPRLARLFEPPPLLLVHHGQMHRGNLRRELLSPEDLMGKLREKGVDDLAQVKRAVMESNGEVSVIRLDGSDTPKGKRQAVKPT